MISDKIYFNHIPKTGGRFLNQIIHSSNQIKTYFIADDEDLSLVEYNNYDCFVGHLGTFPNNMFNNLKTCTLIRNPVDRLVSHYAHFYNSLNKTNDQVLYDFNRWIFNDYQDIFIKTNFQSKCLTNSVLPKINKLPVDKNDFFRNGWRYTKNDTNYTSAKKYLDMCELVLTTENITDNLPNILKFLNVLDVSKTDIMKVLTTNFSEYKNPMSRFILHNLTKLQINKIKELNSIDIKIYEYAKTLS
jgi:hypothetical protein